jgi:hypothetical protein
VGWSVGRAFQIALACLAMSLLATVHACRAPTQLTVEIRTVPPLRCDELRKVTIAVASDPEGAEGKLASEFVTAEVQEKCDGEHDVGTLVLTPSASTGAIVVAADVLGLGPCRPPEYAGCIVSRRAFSFVEHTALVLPMSLELACVDVPCGAVTSCRSGQCVPSDADCRADGTCASEAEPVLGPDGEPIPSDAGVSPDGAPLPDGGIVDSGPDVVDSAVEIEAGPLPVPTNDCPTAFGETDCVQFQAQVCCSRFGESYECADQGGCFGEPEYPCVGRKHCAAGAYCCHTATPVDAGTMRSACGMNCGGFILCGSPADCPGTQKCTGTILGSQRDSGAIRYCQ